MVCYGVELDGISDDKQWLQHLEGIMGEIATDMPSLAPATELEHELRMGPRATWKTSRGNEKWELRNVAKQGNPVRQHGARHAKRLIGGNLLSKKGRGTKLETGRKSLGR